MIDKFALALPHLLLAIAAWRLLFRNDIDSDPETPGPTAEDSSRAPAGGSTHA